MDEEVALAFAADVTEAVASVRDLAANAQVLADTAKAAADGCGTLTESAVAAADAVKGAADSGEAATAVLSAYSDEAKAAAGAAGDLALAQANLKAASAEAKAAVGELAAVQAAAGKDSTEYAAQLDAVTAAMGREAKAATTLKGVQEEQAAAAAQAKTAAGETAAAQDASVAASDRAAAATTTAGTAQAGAATKADVAAGGLARYKMALLGIGVGAAVAVDAAGKFQDSTTHLVTDAGESAKNLATVQQGILGVSAATGQSAQSITDAMYHIESSGFHAGAGLAILKTTAEGARVGGADLDTTSKALVGTLTAYYGTSMTAAQATKDSTSLMNQLITTVGSGDMRMQDLASSLSNVTPVAAAAGISFAQVGGALATMTAQGMSARQASQNLAHAIRSLAAPTNVQAVEMKAMGLNANDVAKNLGKTGLAGTLNEMRDAVLSNTKGGNVMLDMLRGMSPAAQGLANQILAGTISTHDLTSAMKQLNPQQYALVSHFKTAAVSVTGMQQTYTSAMSKMLGGATGLNVGLMLTGTHMGDLTKATTAIATEGAKASSTVDNWSVIQGTFAFKMDQAKTATKDAGIALGSALLPAVTAILGPLASFLAMIAGNKDAAIAFAVVIGGILAGALGLKLAKGLKDAAEGIKAAGDGIGWLVGKFSGVKGAADEAAKGVAAAAEKGAAAQEAAGEEAWKSSGDLAAKSAAAQETAAADSATAWEVSASQEEAAWAAAEEGAAATAAETATVNEEAAAKSSGSWIAAAARQVASAAVWVAQSVAKVAVVVASNVAGAAVTLAGWVATGAGMLAQGVIWVAGTLAKVAVVVAANIAGAVATAAAWVIANGIMLLGIVLVVAAVALAVYEIVKHWSSIVHGAEEAWNAVYHAVSTVLSAVVDFVKSHWQLIVEILTGTVLVALVIQHWKQIEQGAADALKAVVGFFTALPGNILHALGNVGSLLVSVGQNMIRGLVNGIASMGSFLSSAILNLIPSPIRSLVSSALGIFSPSTVFHGFGVNIVQGLVNGVRATVPLLHAAMSLVTGAVSGAGSSLAGPGSALAAGAIAPAGGSTSMHVTVPITVQGSAAAAASPQYLQGLQAAVQEAVLRYGQVNPGNGLTPAWGQ